MARDGSSRPVRYEVSGVINEEAVIHRDDDDDEILIPADDDDDEILIPADDANFSRERE